MKSLFATVGALALMMSAAACGKEDAGPYAAPDASVEASPVPAATPVSTRKAYVLATGEIEASDLMGASVQNPSGEEISIVEDVWLANGSSPALLVLRDGGVAGVGGELRTAAFDAAVILPDPDKPGDEPNVLIRLTAASLDILPAFKQASADDYRLASEMIGKTVTVNSSGDSVRINDLLLSSTGKTNFVVISPDLVSLEQIVVDADSIVVSEGDTDGEVVLDLTAEDIAAAPAYKRE